MMKLSVVICTRNPRYDVFPRVLAALTSQTLLAAAWTDFVPTCLDNGFGSGRFTALHLTHVIPAGRLRFAYHAGVCRGLGST
jgi:hypothetical protein